MLCKPHVWKLYRMAQPHVDYMCPSLPPSLPSKKKTLDANEAREPSLTCHTQHIHVFRSILGHRSRDFTDGRKTQTKCAINLVKFNVTNNHENAVQPGVLWSTVNYL